MEMLDQIKTIIEENRESKSIYWRAGVLLKDCAWIISNRPLRYLKGKKKIAWCTNKRRVEIEITTSCNLKCINCNRSCRQAPSEEHMSLKQIKKFIDESICLNWKWESIKILGGEPTLHPQLPAILKIFKRYKKFYPESNIRFLTNGFGDKVNNILKILPPWLIIENSKKKSSMQKFSSYNLAPIDMKRYKNADFTKACWNTEHCGLGLTRYGYYLCGPGASIDRVFGLDTGIKNLSSVNDSTLMQQRGRLCRYCGMYKEKDYKMGRRIKKEKMSLTWIKAYKKYKKEKPKLSLY